MKTSLGAFLSMVVFALTIAFAINKFQTLILRLNPNINSQIVDLDHNEKFNINNKDFTMAFAVTREQEDGFRRLDDPRYIRIYVSFEKNKKKEYHLLHKCTDAEFAKIELHDNSKTVQQFKNM